MVFSMRNACAHVLALMLITGTANAVEDLPTVGEAIPPAVKTLGVPAKMDFTGGIRMAVSAASENAQQHVLQGLNHLNGGWEFEASRHFAAAMSEDADCLLAHWGMVMCLLDPTPEAASARDAATERMLALIESGAGTELERGYAYGLVKYIQEGPSAAADAFRKVSGRFPNEMQAALLAALFGRGGYGPDGSATPDQERAEKVLFEMIQKNPQSPVPQHALLFIRAEGPVAGEQLAMARSLAMKWPDYPPYQHLLGHYEWRSGHHANAVAAFTRAADLFGKWMKEQNIDAADCPEWLRARCYRVVALLGAGDADAASDAARELAELPLSEKRPASAGNRFLLWEAKTLPARLLMTRTTAGSAAKAAAALPKPDDLATYRDHSLAYWWIDGLRLVLEGRRLLEEKKTDEARGVLEALTHHGEAMTRTRQAARASGEISAWSRAFRALEILTSELRGDLALTGDEVTRGSAFNWFSAATDRQSHASMLMPPMVLSPMAARLGVFRLATGKPAEAVEAYERALELFPGDAALLAALKGACEAAGDTAKAEETARKIEALKTER